MTQVSYFKQHLPSEDVFQRNTPATQTQITQSKLPAWQRSKGTFSLILTVTLIATPMLLGTRHSVVSPLQVLSTESTFDDASGFDWSLPPAPAEWPAASEAAFETMAERNPRLLERWILLGDLSPGHKTLAAEVLGQRAGASAIPSLLRLLQHQSPLVREGAVLGLSHHASDEVIAHLRDVAQNDPSEGVRATAKQTADELAVV